MERVTKAIETRRKERVVITKDVRVALLQDCRHIAKQKNYKVKSKIHVSDLMDYRDKVQWNFEVHKRKPLYCIMTLLGLRNQNEQLLRVLDRAVDLVEHKQGSEDPYFYYMDFNVSQ